MKNVLLLAAAVAIVAPSAVYAGDAAPNTGSDSESYAIAGNAAPFCQFGAPSVGSSTNASMSNLSNSGGSVGITALQGAGTDVEQAWSITVDHNNSVCNYHFDVDFQSANGGLKYQGTETTSDSSFTTLLNYDVATHFAPGQFNDSNVNGHTTTVKVAGFNGGIQPTAGDFQFTFRSPFQNLDSHDLLNGNYSDTVVVSIGPTA